MYDVIVVGAGPSGSVLARLLAVQGVKVLMLDAASFPRRKPCGDSLNPGAVAALRRVMAFNRTKELADSLPLPFPHSILNGWLLNSEGTLLEAAYPTGQYGIGCPRERLDHWLVEQACLAGAQFEQQTRVERLLWEEGRVVGVQVRTSSNKQYHLRASYVAGADGIRSAVARGAGVSSFGSLRKAALTARFDGVRDLSGRVELFMSGDIVIGLSPIGDGIANMTFALQGANVAAATSIGKVNFMLETALKVPELAGRLQQIELQGEVLACGPFERHVRSVAVNGMVLVGDAAGYYDPLTGQGIYRAIRSAELAAPTLIQALHSGGIEPLIRYNRERKSQFANGLRLQKIIEQVSQHNLIWQSALHMIGSSKWLTNRLAKTVGDCP